jgi:hypothetical protein
MARKRLPLLPLLLALTAGCCVTPPSAEEVLNLGFRSPEQTLETFQAGVRGELARLEYRCFSVGFRDRNGLSQLAYREFRERELEPKPWFKLGVADATISHSESLGPLRHRLVAESHGYSFELTLTREDYWQLWSGETLLADEPLGEGGFASFVDLLENPGGSPTLVAGAQLPDSLQHLSVEDLRREMTEFRIAEEWKIDSLRELPSLDTPGPKP